MKDKQKIQIYVNNIRRHLSKSLKPGIGLRTKSHPVEGPGAIITIFLGENESNIDEFAPSSPTINSALQTIDQHAIGGDLSGVSFSSTNVIMERNRIVLIKGEDDPQRWSDVGSSSDVNIILSSSGVTK